MGGVGPTAGGSAGVGADQPAGSTGEGGGSPGGDVAGAGGSIEGGGAVAGAGGSIEGGGAVAGAGGSIEGGAPSDSAGAAGQAGEATAGNGGDCKIGRAQSPDRCLLGRRCNGDYVSADCTNLTGSGWSCTCDTVSLSDPSAHTTFGLALASFAGDSACDAIWETCVAGEPEFTGPEECAVNQSVQTTRCSTVTECTRPVAVTGGEATAGSSRDSITCTPGFDGIDVECFCSGERYEIVDAEVATACERFVESCSEFRETLNGQSYECQTVQDASEPTGCNLRVECERSVGLAGGGTLVESDVQLAGCTSFGEYCFCSGGGGLAYAPGTPAEPTGCAEILAACEDPGALEFGDTFECSVVNQRINADSCEAELGCYQPATLAGEPIEAHGALDVSCFVVSPGQWACQCLGDNGAQVPLEVPTSSDACAQAVAICPELVAIDFDIVGTPIPELP
jgi:hypothetical protein